MLKKQIMLIFILTTISGLISANDSPAKPITKIGINALALLLVGDINASVERSILEKVSFGASLHYFETEQLTDNKGTAFRLSGGVRAYQSGNNLSGNFIEFKVAINHFKEVTEDAGPMTIELFVGQSKDFNEFLFYEGKIGAVRLIDPGKFLPAAGVTIGLKF